jgi:hypothetical protein
VKRRKRQEVSEGCLRRRGREGAHTTHRRNDLREANINARTPTTKMSGPMPKITQEDVNLFF